MYFRKLLYPLLFAILPSTLIAQNKMDANADLYILMGQSNMAGRGPITDKLKNEHDDNVFVLNKEGQWVRGEHPLHFDKQDIAAVGPGLAFGIAMMKATQRQIGLIPCAVGGTSIEQWKPGAFDPVTKTHPYDDAVKRIKMAMTSGTIKGVIWHQGEADSAPERTAVYLSQLKILIDSIRHLVGNNDLPFIAGELGRFLPAATRFNKELKKLPASVEHTAVVSSKGLKHKGDKLHFDGESAEKLGRRYAKRMLSIQ